METVLLGFLLISLTLSSIIVAIEITRDGFRSKGKKQKPLVASQQKEATEVRSVPAPKPRKPAQFTQRKMLENLSRQLANLGYVAEEQQLGFVNWALNSNRNSLSEIKPQEFNYLLGVIQRYTAPTPPKKQVVSHPA